jgi:hypothetical protein
MYVIPTMPIVCNIWWNYTPGGNMYVVPDVVNASCNLSPGKRTFFYTPSVFTSPVWLCPMELLLPPLTDIRTTDQLTGQTCVVEVPSGSLRFYQVTFVDDIAKGFANEHRFAILHRFNTQLTFIDVGPVPVSFWPLP